MRALAVRAAAVIVAATAGKAGVAGACRTSASAASSPGGGSERAESIASRDGSAASAARKVPRSTQPWNGATWEGGRAGMAQRARGVSARAAAPRHDLSSCSLHLPLVGRISPISPPYLPSPPDRRRGCRGRRASRPARPRGRSPARPRSASSYMGVPWTFLAVRCGVASAGSRLGPTGSATPHLGSAKMTCQAEAFEGGAGR